VAIRPIDRPDSPDPRLGVLVTVRDRLLGEGPSAGDSLAELLKQGARLLHGIAPRRARRPARRPPRAWLRPTRRPRGRGFGGLDISLGGACLADRGRLRRGRRHQPGGSGAGSRVRIGFAPPGELQPFGHLVRGGAVRALQGLVFGSRPGGRHAGGLGSLAQQRQGLRSAPAGAAGRRATGGGHRPSSQQHSGREPITRRGGLLPGLRQFPPARSAGRAYGSEPSSRTSSSRAAARASSAALVASSASCQNRVATTASAARLRSASSSVRVSGRPAARVRTCFASVRNCARLLGEGGRAELQGLRERLESRGFGQCSLRRRRAPTWLAAGSRSGSSVPGARPEITPNRNVPSIRSRRGLWQVRGRSGERDVRSTRSACPARGWAGSAASRVTRLLVSSGPTADTVQESVSGSRLCTVATEQAGRRHRRLDPGAQDVVRRHPGPVEDRAEGVLHLGSPAQSGRGSGSSIARPQLGRLLPGRGRLAASPRPAGPDRAGLAPPAPRQPGWQRARAGQPTLVRWRTPSARSSTGPGCADDILSAGSRRRWRRPACSVPPCKPRA